MSLLYLALLPMTSFIIRTTTCNIQNSISYTLRIATESDHILMLLRSYYSLDYLIFIVNTHYDIQMYLRVL